MILVTFDFAMRSGGGVVYQGTTNFGFFSRPALAQQVGVPNAFSVRNDARKNGPRARSFDYPADAPFPRRNDRCG